MDIQKIVVNGKNIDTKDAFIIVPVNAKKVEFYWQKKAEVLPLNYQKAVEDYKQEYRRRYQEFLEYGN